MNKEDLLKQIQEDIEIAKALSTITDGDELLSLEARMVGYLQPLQDSADEFEYKSTQMKSKVKLLKEYIKTIHSRRTELSISSSLTRKGI